MAWIAWWAWRYAGVQSLPGFRQPDGAAMTPVGFAADAALLYAVFNWLRWRSAVRSLSEHKSSGRAWLEVVALTMALSAILRALDALHAHLVGSHLTVRFWRAFGEQLGDWAMGMHTLLIAALVTAVLGRWVLNRHVAQGPTFMRHLAGPKPAAWLQTQIRVAIGVGVVGLVATGVGGIGADGTAVMPEIRALLTLFEALTGPAG